MHKLKLLKEMYYFAMHDCMFIFLRLLRTTTALYLKIQPCQKKARLYGNTIFWTLPNTHSKQIICYFEHSKNSKFYFPLDPLGVHPGTSRGPETLEWKAWH